MSPDGPDTACCCVVAGWGELHETAVVVMIVRRSTYGVRIRMLEARIRTSYTAGSMFTLRRIGQSFYAIALIAFGIQTLVYRQFVTRAVPSWPEWFPGRPLWAVIIAAVLIAGGVCLLLNLRTRAIALTLGIGLFCSFLFLGLPIAAGDVLWGGLWTSAMKALALSGGALIIGGTVRSFQERSSFAAPPERVVAVGRVF